MNFCIERLKRLKTNIELFQKHFRLLKNCDPEYVHSFSKEYCSEIKLVICKESFTHDDIVFYKGDLYAITIMKGDSLIFELTGQWEEGKGHDGRCLKYRAMFEGIKAWFIPLKFNDNLKELNEKALNEFMYWG